MQTVGDVAETPASNGGRGLKQVDKQATFNTFSETPASNGGRGLKRKPAHTPHARQLETPASNGGRGLKPHGAERGDHCQPRNARQQWRARIETGCAALARTPRLRNARQQWRARIETLFVNRLAHRHDETPASNGGRGLKRAARSNHSVTVMTMRLSCKLSWWLDLGYFYVAWCLSLVGVYGLFRAAFTAVSQRAGSPGLPRTP